jgi:hypothetical protein
MTISVWGYGYENLASSDVYARCIGLQHWPVFQTHTFLSLFTRSRLGSLGFTRIVFWVLLGGHTAILSAPSSGQVALKKGILLIGISLKTSQAVNHCITHGTWDHARIRALTTAPLI